MVQNLIYERSEISQAYRKVYSTHYCQQNKQLASRHVCCIDDESRLEQATQSIGVRFDIGFQPTRTWNSSGQIVTVGVS